MSKTTLFRHAFHIWSSSRTHKAKHLQINCRILRVQHKYFVSVQNLLKMCSFSFTFSNAAYVLIAPIADVTTLCKRINLAKYEMVAEIQPGLPTEEKFWHFNLLLVSSGASSPYKLFKNILLLNMHQLEVGKADGLNKLGIAFQPCLSSSPLANLSSSSSQ